MGYTQKFIDVATEGLMVYVTRGSKNADAESKPQS
jgi:hypothetical protein